MRVAITVDVEHDCPPYLTTYRGVEEGLPRVLELLAEEDVHGTFFVTGDVARRYPERVRAIVDCGHELGSHSDTHPRFSKLEPADARDEIEAGLQAVRGFAPVTAFRAPNFDLPTSYLPFLRDAGVTVDSSQGRHKPGSFFVNPHVTDSVVRVAASTAPSVIRLPRLLRHAALARLKDPVVLFFHPWEFVDVTREPIPVDCRYRTGQVGLDTLRDSIRFYRRRSAQFMRIGELAGAA